MFGLPLAVLLCFGLDGGVQGMWWGLDCGQLARLLLMLQRRSKLDLVAASELAQRRAHHGEMQLERPRRAAPRRL